MNDFQLVIDFLFTILSKFWQVIRANFLLSISLLVIILSWLITTLKAAKGDR